MALENQIKLVNIIIKKSLGCKPIASLDHFTAENLGSADLVEEVTTGQSKIVKVIYNFI